MTREELFGKLQEIFRDIFDDETLEIDDSTNSTDIANWDSLKHINIVYSIEKEIGIKFSFEELATLKNVGAMVNVLLTKV